MKIPRQEDVALLLMGELAKHYRKGRLSLSAVASTHGVSSLFLKKIARMLRGRGLIESKEGASGGYVLSRSPGEITVWEVILAVAVENPSVSVELKEKIICPLYSTCLPQQITKRVHEALEKSFSHMRVSDLL